MTGQPGGERPAYKGHPLWGRAIALARDAYSLADAIRPGDAGAAHRLRQAAVAVPARVAQALSSRGGRRVEEALAARGALAEVARQARRTGREEAWRLEASAEELDRIVLFEFGADEESIS